MAKCRRRMVDQEDLTSGSASSSSRSSSSASSATTASSRSASSYSTSSPPSVRGGARSSWALEDATSDVMLAVDVKLKAVQERIKHERKQLALRPTAEEVVESLHREKCPVDKSNQNKENQVFFGGDGGGGGNADEIIALSSYLYINGIPTWLAAGFK